MNKLIVVLLLCANIFAAPRVGDKSIDFKLPDLYNQNRLVSANDLKGKVVLLNLWASWCSGCKEEMPLFVELQSEYSKNKFEIVLSSIDSSKENAISFLKEVDKDKTLTSLYDEDKSLPKDYRCPGMPSSFLIDKNGKIVKVYIGSLDEDEVEKLKAKIEELIGK